MAAAMTLLPFPAQPGVALDSKALPYLMRRFEAECLTNSQQEVVRPVEGEKKVSVDR